jgi:hypothetical protein
MAKGIYCCFREGIPGTARNKLHAICKRLEPDNIRPPSPLIHTAGRIAYGIMNPPKSILKNGNSLLLGQLFGTCSDWHVPMAEFADGSYALFRDDDNYCEIVSDPVASRTIWYFMNNDLFVASTSQRAIIMLLGSFEFDDRIIPWMLSTGTLGPSFSWDRRIRRVPPDSSVILNKKTWSLSEKVNIAEFRTIRRTDRDHEDLLRKSLRETFENLKPDFKYWVLPLSGGYDSRGILCLLREAGTDFGKLRTITWGLKSSLHIKGNDAIVARKLAEKMNVSNTYYENDLTDEPVHKIVERFILLGEGRIDGISDYLDGFRMWKNIFEDGIEGIIRGDENFGCKPYSSSLAVRINEGCTLCTDLDNLKDYKKYGFPDQKIPDHLNWQDGDSLNVWRDKLFHSVALPTEFSALSDLKFSYVEQINPLLSKRILKQVREMPDRLRTGKFMFKKIVDSMSPDIEYATKQSSKSQIEILSQDNIAGFIRNELTSEFAKSVLPAEFLEFVTVSNVANAKPGQNGKMNGSLRKIAGAVIPRYLKEVFRDKIRSHSVDPNILAFRAMLIVSMNRVLNRDSEIFNERLPQKLELSTR